MSLAARAEVLKLARLLGEPPGALGYLEAAPADALAALREQVTDVLFDGDRRALGRIAEAGKVVPVAVMASVGQGVFGPTLCARLTGLLEPDRALAVGLRMDPPFLARVAAEMDPRRAAVVIARTVPETSREVARRMAAAGEHVAMGRFVAHLSDEALAVCLPVLDDADLLRTAFVLEGKDRLDRLVEMLPDDRLARLAGVAAQERLFDEALDLLAHLGPAQVERLARATAGQDPAALAGVSEAAARNGLQDVVERARRHGLPLP